MIKRGLPTQKASEHHIFLVENVRKIIPLKFEKAGWVWCGGARETHSAKCHN